VLAGGFAAISTVFGGPIPSSIVLLEMTAASGLIASASLGPSLVPGLIAAGTGSLIFTGVRDWQGLHQAVLSLPSFPHYPTVRFVDVVWCILLAAVIGAAVTAIRLFAQRLAQTTRRRVTTFLVAGGFAIGLAAVLFKAVASRPTDLVLFSGQNSLGDVINEQSAGVLLCLVVAKSLGYLLSLGMGFRGGPIFPALTIGMVIGALGASVLPGLALAPAIASGLAAGGASYMRLPIFGAVMSVLLVGSANFDVVPIVILAAVTAWLVATALSVWFGPPAPVGRINSIGHTSSACRAH
jgi:H+/Cl- antiporter ClcA